jgi:hypothetical protein
MHNLKPKTHYKFINVTLACPISITDGEIADGLNEMLNHVIIQSDTVFDDWRIDFPYDSSTEKMTGDSPEEGELFQ